MLNERRAYATLCAGTVVMVAGLPVRLEQDAKISAHAATLHEAEHLVPNAFAPSAIDGPISPDAQLAALTARVLDLEHRLFFMADQLHGVRGVLGLWTSGGLAGRG